MATSGLVKSEIGADLWQPSLDSRIRSMILVIDIDDFSPEIEILTELDVLNNPNVKSFRLMEDKFKRNCRRAVIEYMNESDAELALCFMKKVVCGKTVDRTNLGRMLLSIAALENAKITEDKTKGINRIGQYEAALFVFLNDEPNPEPRLRELLEPYGTIVSVMKVLPLRYATVTFRRFSAAYAADLCLSDTVWNGFVVQIQSIDDPYERGILILPVKH